MKQSVSSGLGHWYLNWLILSQENVTDIINQEKQCRNL